MKKYTIIFEKAALKFLRKQDKSTQTRLLKVISKLPEGTDIKKLQGYSELYRLRVGNFRVIYTIKEELLISKTLITEEIFIRNINKKI